MSTFDDLASASAAVIALDAFKRGMASCDAVLGNDSAPSLLDAFNAEIAADGIPSEIAQPVLDAIAAAMPAMQNVRDKLVAAQQLLGH